MQRHCTPCTKLKFLSELQEALLQPDGVWDPTQLESAKSSLIFEVIEREKSVGDLVVQSLLSTFKMVPNDYNRLMVKVGHSRKVCVCGEESNSI